MAKPKVGDRVWHHGRPHTLSRIDKQAAMVDGKAVAIEMAVFSSAEDRPPEEDYTVRGILAELEWDEADDAWTLPGRLLSQDERVVHEAVVGVRPRPDQHFAARAYLDTIDLSTVGRDRLKEVVLTRKLGHLEQSGVVEVKRKEGGAPGVKVPDEKVLDAYLDRVIGHVEELRALRKGG